MTYEIKIKTIEKIFEGKTEKEGTLDAHFSFGEETAPKDNELVRERINLFFEKVKQKREKYEGVDIPDEYILKSPEVVKGYADYVGWAKRPLFGLRFSIFLLSFNSYSNAPLEKMIDFDAINNYILGE